MKTRFLAIGLAVISAALVACGGGGGGGGNPTPPTAAPSTGPTPTPKPTNNPYGCVGQTPFIAAAPVKNLAAPRPIASGDVFTYTGSLSQTYAQSAPCPQPTSTATATISTDVTDTATTAPGGGGATASTASETDAYSTHTGTLSTTSVLQIGASKLLLYSTDSNDGSGNSIRTSYNNAQEIDDLAAGGTWTNDPSATIAETLADGSSVQRTLFSDGSYSDTQTYTNGATATISVNGAANTKTLDGAGSYTFAGITFAYAAPTGGSITLTISSPGSPDKTRTFPSWFTPPAAGGSLVTDTFADNGSKPFDSTCTVPASIGTSGTQVVETYSAVDPILGYTETRTTTSYEVAGYGPACVTIADTLNSYYDYSLDTTKIDYQSQNGQPNSVNTIAETLSMQSAVCGSGSPPCAQLRRSVTQAVSARVAARIGAIEHYRAVQRAHQLQSLRALALHFVHQGAVR